MRLFKNDVIFHLIISTLFLTIVLLFLALIIDARMLIEILILFIWLLIFLEICGTLKRKYLINQIKNLSEDENEDIINLIKEDKFLDTKEIRRGLTILFTALYITVILGYVPCKDIKALSAVYGVIV
ncbi:MAG: hypothetical protein ABGW92_02695, partial [Methanocaldococcus sp.]